MASPSILQAFGLWIQAFGSWSLANSDTLRNLSLSLAGIIGLPLLIWRTHAANKSAIAQVRSAEAARGSAEAALGVVQATRAQIEVAMQNAEASKQQAAAAVDQAKVALERQITETLARAIELLKNDDIAVRLGAILILERVARDSKRDGYAIENLLMNFVRVVSRRPHEYLEDLPEETRKVLKSPTGEKFLKERPEWLYLRSDVRADVQAAIRALGSQLTTINGINLSDTDLQGGEFSGLSFREATIGRAKFRGSKFSKVDLSGAELVGVDFSGCLMPYADLRRVRAFACTFDRATLQETRMQGAVFESCRFAQADLKDVDVNDAKFVNCDLSEAKGVVEEQFRLANFDGRTRFPWSRQTGGAG